MGLTISSLRLAQGFSEAMEQGAAHFADEVANLLPHLPADDGQAGGSGREKEWLFTLRTLTFL